MALKTGMALLVLFLSVIQTACADSSETKIRWMGYDTAREQQPPVEKKLFIYFSSANCGYCRMMDKEVFNRDDIADYINSNYTPVRVDIDRNRKVAMQFGVQGVPDLRFLTPGGESIARWPGYTEAKHLLAMLRYVYTDSYLKMGFQEFTKQQ